mgnify:FL=1
MLVLSRGVEEEIIIGDNTKIKVLGINNGKVSLGFDAPKDVQIHRKEIYQRIQDGVPFSKK